MGILLRNAPQSPSHPARSHPIRLGGRGGLRGLESGPAASLGPLPSAGRAPASALVPAFGRGRSTNPPTHTRFGNPPTAFLTAPTTPLLLQCVPGGRGACKGYISPWRMQTCISLSTLFGSLSIEINIMIPGSAKKRNRTQERPMHVHPIHNGTTVQ